MDETSYSDPVIVETINKKFVPVRVDTDKRPDINRRYNLGGWPTTAFLDSEGRIITGGTYIPPQQLRDVLRSVLDFYSSNKGKITSKLQRSSPLKPRNEPLSEKIIKDIGTTIALEFDIDYGGFGFEPKFPHSEALELALLRYRYHGEKEMLTLVTKTLDKMGNGGVYDKIEEGFFRYSTTRDWSIPHFEKMAEDNAKLLGVYLHAYQLTSKSFYKEKAEGIIKYVQRTLSNGEMGGFFGSQDADEHYYSLDIAGRRGHKTPAVDKTLYTNYNALFVSSFILASIILKEPDLGKVALKTLDRLIGLAGSEGVPPHYWRENEHVPKGFLVDYATLIHALLDAYEHTGNRRHLDEAVTLTENCIRDLSDGTGGGFYDIPSADSNLGELKTRDKPIDENSLTAMALSRISWLTGDAKYSQLAEKTLALFNGDYERYGLAAATYALALDSQINGPVGITIIAPPKSRDLGALRAKALSFYSGRRYVSYLEPKRDATRIHDLGYDATRGPVAYICAGKTCGPPIHDPSQMETTLSSLLELKPLA